MALGSIPPSGVKQLQSKSDQTGITYMSFHKLDVLIIFNAEADERNSSYYE